MAVVHRATRAAHLVESGRVDGKTGEGYVEVVALADRVLTELRALELDDALLETDGGLPWHRFEAPVEALLDTVRRCADELLRRFTREGSDTEDLLDLELAHALDDPRDGAPSPIRDRYELRLSRLFDAVEPGVLSTADPVLAEIAAILHRAAVEHAQRLERSVLTREAGALVIELEEIRSKLEHALETTQAVVFRALSDASLLDLVPDLPTPTTRAAGLREWGLDLEAALVAALAERDRFSAARARVEAAAERPETSWLRPHDRAAFLAFRRWARSVEEPAPEELEPRLDELLAFATGLRRINDRELLRKNDARAADAALELLARGAGSRPVLVRLRELRGRDADLDTLIERARRGEALDTAELSVHLRRVGRSLRSGLRG